ncbi:MAG: Rpn family recombination-promoting nuclease/putative transposase, partial [Planctomycetota bacterium]|nr:Rpn family recombination-promoting nuclease/putative transposase [Planctomycetota bacterium]
MSAGNKDQAPTREASSGPGHVHDRLFRFILQDSEVLTHLFTDIQALIERDKVKIWGKGFSAVNGEALVRLSSEWITTDFKEPRGDLVLKAPLQGKNQDATVVVIFEHQSTSQPVFSLRALNYLNRVYQDSFKKY